MVGEESKFQHEKADITNLYLKEAIGAGKKVIFIATDDTDIFILLVYYTWKWKPET